MLHATSTRRHLTLALYSCLFLAALAAPGSAAAADRYVSTSGADTNACTATAPCRSFDRANRSASPGMTVEVAAGSYGGQSIGNDTTKTSTNDVVFQPASGANVTLSGLSIPGKHVEIRNMLTGFVNIEGGSATDITVRNGGGSGIFIGGGISQVQIVGGSYGGGSPNVAPVKVQGSPAPSNITFDGVIFHDAVRTDPEAHLECIYAADVQGFTVRNSQFRNCAIMDLFITKLSGVNPRDVLIENNFFDITGSHGGSLSKGYYSLVVANHLDNATNFTIRNNSFAESMSIDSGSLSNFKVEGNNGLLSICRSGASFAGNVWTSRTCSSSDRQAASGFTDVANYDLHLNAGAAAVDGMMGGASTATDIDGQTRPAGVRADAGADESGGSTTPPPADTTAPDSTITGGPSGSTAETAASFSFTASETGSTFTCRLDGGAWGACATPKAYSGLSVASHTFDVRATDVAGNLDASPATWTWTVSATTPPPADTTPPDTTITGGPTATTTMTTASLTFSATEAGSTFECRLDGGAWAACSSPEAYSGLSAASHTFNVRATDLAGNTDTTPAARTWTVSAATDTTAPDTTITAAPASPTTSSSASLSFTATEAGSTFQCRLDDGVWAACTSPKSYLGLSTGTHTFDVRATDAVGNTDATPATRSWTIGSFVDVGLIGTKSIESQTDQVAAGTAEAFAMSAWRTGTERKLEVYVSPGGGATTVVAGIYADAGGRPGALLGQGSSTVTNSAWNRIALPERAVTNGTRYWVAILGTGGALRYRDSGSGSSQTSAQGTLTTLPSTWTSGRARTNGVLSVLVSGAAG